MSILFRNSWIPSCVRFDGDDGGSSGDSYGDADSDASGGGGGAGATDGGVEGTAGTDNDGSDSDGVGDGLGDNDNDDNPGGFDSNDFDNSDTTSSDIQWGREQSDSFLGSSIGEDTPLGQEDSDIDSSIDFSGFSTETEAADQSGYSIDGILGYDAHTTASYNPETGFTSTLEGYSSFIGANGVELGYYDQAAANALEVLGITVDRDNINAVESVVEFGISLALGSTGIGLAVSASRAANDVGLATGAIDKDTHDAINTGLAIAGFAVSAYQGIQAIENGIEAINAGYGTVGAISLASSAISLTVALGRLNSAMQQAGVDTNAFADMDSIFGAEDGENWNGLNVDVAANELVNSLEDELDKIDDMLSNDLLGQGEADTYDYLAGGMYYDIKLAGEDLNNPLNESFEVSAENKDLMVSDEVVQMNLQTDGIEPLWDLLPLPVAELATKA